MGNQTLPVWVIRLLAPRSHIMWLMINKKIQKGFTLIELITVIAIIGLIIGISIPSFMTYSNIQSLQAGTLGVVTTLQQAKSSSESQAKPSSCAQTLDGYQVRILTYQTYQLGVMCSNVYTGGPIQSLPSTTKFSVSSQTFFFKTQHNGVTFPTGNKIVIKNQVGSTNTITVDALGNISSTNP